MVKRRLSRRLRRARWWLPVVRGGWLAGPEEDPAHRLARTFPLPRYLCIWNPRHVRRSDAECLELPTGRAFSVECGRDWGRIYVPIHAHQSRSQVRAGLRAERLLRVLGGTPD